MFRIQSKRKTEQLLRRPEYPVLRSLRYRAFQFRGIPGILFIKRGVWFTEVFSLEGYQIGRGI